MDLFRRAVIIVLFVLSLLPSHQVLSQFSTLETKNLRLVYYDPEHAYLLPHIARCFESSLHFHRSLFQYTPSEPVTVFLHDINDYGSGGTNSVPWNYISIGIEPFDYVYETVPTNERMNWMMNHELAHVVDLDKPAGSDRFFRTLFFGKVPPSPDDPLSMGYSYLANPRYYSPRWYHEGIAVFLETWMAGGIGRSLGGYDEMVFRSMVRDSAYFYDFVGLESEGKTIDFQIGETSYLYGTRFMSYLAVLDGPEKLLQWVNRSDCSDAYFASEFRKLYGMPLDEAWTRWIGFEHQWQRANLDSIRLFPVTPERPLTPKGLGSVSRAYYDSVRGKFYFAVNFPGRLAHTVAVDRSDGRMTDLCDIPTPALYYVTSLAYDDSSRSLFYSTHNGYGWRDLNVVDAVSGNSSLLIKNCRVGDLAFNRADKSLWGVRHSDGRSSLVRIPPPYQSIYEIQTLEYGKDIFDLDISPDGQWLVASAIDVSGRQQLVRMSVPKLMAGSQDVEMLYEFENNSPENFVYSPDGKYLYGTSYYTGVSNVFRYDFQTKKMDALSNAETGYFRPLPVGNDSLLVFTYTGNGFQPVIMPIRVREDLSAVKYLGQEIVDKYPIVKTWNVGSPLAVNIDSLTTYQGAYNGLGRMQISSLYPVVQGYKSVVAYGLRLNLADPAGLHSLDITSAYSPQHTVDTDERFHLGLNYHYWQWKVNASYNNSNFYDLFGPTKVSRKGSSLSIGYSDFLLYDRPKTLEYTLSMSGYTGLERLPDFQNVVTNIDRFAILRGKLEYKYLLRSIGSVEVEKGIDWNLNAMSTFVSSRAVTAVYGNLDLGFMLPLDHSSLWLRGSAGYSPGDRDDLFANFYFGGFGNNWVDYQSVKRYREYYSFPGVDLNSIGGTNYAKLITELTLPPIRFKRFGTPNFYCTWAHPTLFVSGIVTNMDDYPSRGILYDAGSQIDFQTVLFANLESTLSIGYAFAFERRERASNEFMISIKLL